MEKVGVDLEAYKRENDHDGHLREFSERLYEKLSSVVQGEAAPYIENLERDGLKTIILERMSCNYFCFSQLSSFSNNSCQYLARHKL